MLLSFMLTRTRAGYRTLAEMDSRLGFVNVNHKGKQFFGSEQ